MREVELRWWHNQKGATAGDAAHIRRLLANPFEKANEAGNLHTGVELGTPSDCGNTVVQAGGELLALLPPYGAVAGFRQPVCLPGATRRLLALRLATTRTDAGILGVHVGRVAALAVRGTTPS